MSNIPAGDEGVQSSTYSLSPRIGPSFDVKDYTLAKLADILDECQPSVSNLLRGRISQVSIEKLLRYADRLHLQTALRCVQWQATGAQDRAGRNQSRAA